MANASGDAGLGTAGVLAAGAAVLAVIAGVLYATGVLGPRDQADVAVPTETETAVAPEPEAVPAQDTAAVTEPDDESAAAETPQPAGDAETTSGEDAAQTDAPVEDTEPDEAPSETADTPSAAAQAPEETAEAPEAAPDDPAADTADTQADDGAETVATESPAPLTAPSFDVVRAAPDGSVVIAGRGMPGSVVTILLDGAPAMEVTVGASGEFVSFLDVTYDSAPRVLSLLARRDDEEAISDEDIILAPRPTALAQAEPQEDPSAPAETAATGTADAAEDTTDEASTDPAPTGTTAGETSTSDTAESETTPPSESPPAPTAGTDAPQQPAIAVLRSDSSGVRVIQPAEPARDTDQIVLDTIGYSPEGDVLLSGRSAANSALRIYLNNSAIADLSSDGDGRWQTRLTDVAPGIYTLRLDALDADGAVISRLETPFKRESAETLAAATEAPEPDEAPEAPPPVTQVTVQTGDTLWAISRERYGDGLLYVRVFEANSDSIRDPDLIYPGQVFTIPE